MYAREANEYYKIREEKNKRLILLAKEKMDQLDALIRKNGILAELVLTSSLNGGTNLIEDSDIDITMLVDDCGEKMKDLVNKVLVTSGFFYQKMIHGYYLFSQKTLEVEFEVKLRERFIAIPIIRLHEKLNNLSEKEKIIITYGKFLFKKSSCYGIFKMLVYNMYFADMEGCYLLGV